MVQVWVRRTTPGRCFKHPLDISHSPNSNIFKPQHLTKCSPSFSPGCPCLFPLKSKKHRFNTQEFRRFFSIFSGKSGFPGNPVFREIRGLPDLEIREGADEAEGRPAHAEDRQGLGGSVDRCLAVQRVANVGSGVWEAREDHPTDHITGGALGLVHPLILVGGLVAIFYFPIYWDSNHPN